MSHSHLHDIYDTRICVQQVLPHHKDELNNIRQNGRSPEHTHKLEAAFWAKKVWPKDTKIYYTFLDTGKQVTRTSIQDLENAGAGKGGSIDPLQKDADKMSVQQMIKKIVRERIQPLVNLHIEYTDNKNLAHIRISFDPEGGAYSLVGTDALHVTDTSKPTMNLGWFDVPTTMHEWGHALGMIHEHQNPRGNKIKWNDAKVFEWAKATQGWDEKTTETNILDKYNINSINGSIFDPESIMLYFFPAELTLNNKGTHQNLRLSGLDVEWICKMYPKVGGQTPDEFYEKVYGESLEKSIEHSKAEDNMMVGDPNNGGNNNSKIIWIVLGIILGLLVIFGIFWYFRKGKKGRSYYSYRR